MATYYIDFVNGNNSNNGTSESTPVKNWNTANIGGGTFAPGDTIKFKGGVTYVLASRIQFGLSSTPTVGTPVTFTSYGTGRAILNGSGTVNALIYPPTIDAATPGRYIIIDNLEFEDSGGVFVFLWDSLGRTTIDAYNTVRNCVMRGAGGTDKPAIQSWGVGTVIEGNFITDSAWDSIQVQGEENTIRWNTITFPGRTTTTGGDDCIQLVGDCHDCVIEFNYCDKRGYGPWKQAIVAKGDRTIVRYNTLIGPSDGAGLLTLDGGTGMAVYGNYLEGNDGIYALNATGPHQIYGNVVVGTDPSLPVGESTGIDHFSSPMRNHDIFNNTVIGHKRGIFCESASARNNIVIDCGGTGVDSGTGASVESYNCSYGNATNFSGTPGTGSLQVDPQLAHDYMPRTATLWTAGLALGYTDRYGITFVNTIGAVQYQSAQATAAYPKFLYDNRFLDAAPAASTTATGFDVDNLTDMRPYSFWRPTAMPATITVDCGAATAADFAALCGHDLATSHSTVEIRASTDNFSASDVLMIRRTPESDEPLILPFDSASYRYWRIKLIGATAPTLAIALIGTALPLPRHHQIGFDPTARSARSLVNRSVGGYPLGKVTAYEEWSQQISIDVVTWAWIRDTWTPAWKAYLRDEPFLYAWDSTDHPREVYLVQAGSDFKTPTVSGNYAGLEFTLTGVAN